LTDGDLKEGLLTTEIDELEHFDWMEVGAELMLKTFLLIF
jgi:hypothetical protein